MGLTRSTIKFQKKGTLVCFDIIHNLAGMPDVNINSACKSWAARTKDLTDTSFKTYLESKGFLALTVEDYESL
jgi:hypothetical protein